MLIFSNLPEQLKLYKQLLQREDDNPIQIAELSKILIDRMETELICEGLLPPIES